MLPQKNGPQNGPQPAPFLLAAPGEQNEEAGFDFWGVLNRRKWLVFLGLVTGMGLGALYDAQCETVYRSVAKVKIEPKDPVVMPMSNQRILPTAAELTIRHDQLIGQYNIVDNCLTKYDLKNLTSFENLSEDKIVPTVMSNLEVSQNKEEQVLYDLVFYSSEPEDAQTILNNLIRSYEENLNEQYKNENDEVEKLLKGVYDEFTGNYKDLQNELDIIFSNNQAPVVTDTGLTEYEVQVVALGKILSEARNKLGFLDKDYQRAIAALESGPDAIEKHVWNLKEEGKIKDDGKREETRKRRNEQAELQIRNLEIELDRLKQRLGTGHRDVQGLMTTIDNWRQYLEDDSQLSDLDSGVAPEEVLRRHISLLEQQIFDTRSMMEVNYKDYERNRQKATELAMVKRKVDEIKSRQNEFSDFVRMAKERLIEIDSGNAGKNSDEGFRFQILQNATLGDPVWPVLPIILGIGGMLGSLVGFGLGCLVELADKTFHNPDEIMKQLHVPLIGHIPVIGQSKRYLVENSLIEPVVCTYHRPKSQVSEAFRAVRTALYFNTQGKHHSVIQVTSPTPGDGKSTLASNLAVSIAQSGKRVLLVDADMRRPRQHATFGISSKEGFATILSGQSQWRDVIYECNEIEGLSIMPCGLKPNNPAELSSSPQVKVLISEMREEFDFVIIDTPPMLAVTDPCPIAARVDGVILCLRIKKNVRVSAERATEMIANLGANCIGLVVNGVGAQSGYGSQYTYGAYRAGYSYNGYGYGYGYGYGNGKYYDEDQKGRQVPASPKHLENKSGEVESQQPPVA